MIDYYFLSLLIMIFNVSSKINKFLIERNNFYPFILVLTLCCFCILPISISCSTVPLFGVGDVRNTTSWLHHVSEGVLVKLAVDVEVVVLLVGLNGKREGFIKVIIEIGRWRVRDVTESVEVVFDS